MNETKISVSKKLITLSLELNNIEVIIHNLNNDLNTGKFDPNYYLNYWDYLDYKRDDILKEVDDLLNKYR